jgi:hypothetical protein
MSRFVFGLLWIPLWVVFKTSVVDEAVPGLLFFSSICVFVVSGCLHGLLDDLERAKTVWWDDSISATVGLYILAALVKIGAANAVGRAVWRLAFGVGYPGSDQPPEHSGRSVLERIRPHLQYVSLLSLGASLLGVALWDQLLGVLASVDTTVSGAGIIAVSALGVGAVLAGVAVGGLVAVSRR